ncbi:CRAL-TRIO domain-containing protein [Clohesyomyces aquaticus]|uniref:Phosphatidylinositol transfer protein SFH5 n=1 Tax=Clohesyomyces aquaticus TaxID=1231657 RepID=A0A1Y1ZX93_9PLEO|nr:CRAL-TRIO domain-containing protein [Clohesyomyces aquaticus]
MSSEPGKPSTGEPNIGVTNVGDQAADLLEKQEQAAKQQKESEPESGTGDKDKQTKDAPSAYVAPETKGQDFGEEKKTEDAGGLTWPETGPDHPLTKFFESVPELTEEAGYDEVYGIQLRKEDPFRTKLILQKFLRANAGEVEKAREQLVGTLKWRKEFDPVKAMSESFEKERFDGLGYIVEVDGVPESANKVDTATFNIYGAVKDNKKTFGDLDGFLRWRVGLMERSVHKLGLSTGTRPIPDFGQGPDPYQGFQVHDYLQVSFLRMDPDAKAASKKTIETFQKYYPETLSRKFFVNVPLVMGWLFAAMKLFVAKETVKKFTVLSYGADLAGELGKGVPKEYGGEKGELKEVGETMG